MTNHSDTDTDYRRLEALTALPESLRTDQCYTDLQRRMFVVLFRHCMAAIREGKANLCENCLDLISTFLYIHFTDEEEGLVFSMVRWADYDRQQLANHMELHLSFLAYWRDSIYGPAKRGELAGQKLYGAVGHYYSLIIKHIDDNDQNTYGLNAGDRCDRNRTAISHLARCGLPLSPYMPGAYDLVAYLEPEVAAALGREMLPLKANGSSQRMTLTPCEPLLGGRSLRDRAYARAQWMGGSPAWVRAA